MHEIGHALGLAHSYDLNSIMGAGLDGEPVFPGDYDIEHLRQLYPASGSDIDVYRFTLSEPGRVAMQTVIARPGKAVTSLLDSVISLYREDLVDGKAVRTLIARNDDYYGRDSFIGLDVVAGDYFVVVSSKGNTAFNPEVSDSGGGGISEGSYRLKLHFAPESSAANTIVDLTGRPLDGDRDGKAGGAFRFWFNTAAVENTIFVDNRNWAAGQGTGTLQNPYTTIAGALARAQYDNDTRIVRIVGDSDTPYLIGLDPFGRPLADGSRFVVPAGKTVQIDAGASFKLRSAIIDVGSSSEIEPRASAALQVLGTPTSQVTFTSWHDDSVGGDSDGAGMVKAGPGQWGGIVFRNDSDVASKQAFLNTISNALIRHGGGEVSVDSRRETFAPIQLESTRPTIIFNTISNNSGSAISATPNSLEDDGVSFGPDIVGNTLLHNSINGLFVKTTTAYGESVERLSVQARFRNTDIVYVIAENLIIEGGAGGYLEQTDPATGIAEYYARASGRLVIDPGVVVKLQGSRIELELGMSRLYAEGTPNHEVVFTSIADSRYGTGGTFDTNGNVPDLYDSFGEPIGALQIGHWGGIVLEGASQASIAYAYLAFGGGVVPIEGGFDSFNVMEVHQGQLRLADSRLELNASGESEGDRNGRGGNAAATLFVLGAQPIIVGNDFRDNVGAVISINANSLSDVEQGDIGRQIGFIDRYESFDDNRGPLVRENQMSRDLIRSKSIGSQPGSPGVPWVPYSDDATEVKQILWNGESATVVADRWIVRAESAVGFDLPRGWDSGAIGEGFYVLVTPGASSIQVQAWANATAGVWYVEPNFVLESLATRPTDPFYGDLWGLENTGQQGGAPGADISAPIAWDVTTGSSDIVIAVIDSGVDYTHPDLAENIWINPGEIAGDGIDNDGNGFIDDVRGWDFADGDNDPMDEDIHGTHVAGTIGAVANNGIGIAGVAWDVQILPLKIFGGGPTTTLQAAIGALDYLARLRRDFGVNVVASNNSWGGYFYSQALKDVIDACGDVGILTIAAAGNDGNNNDGRMAAYPASYDSPSIIAVAATDRFDELAGFSNYGARSVDVGAPGVGILSTVPGGEYAVLEGTSMAAPHVAGAVALVAAANPGASAATIRQTILATAERLPSLRGQVATGGRLDVGAAVTFAR